ncbi:MAG: hypothetical protein ABI690_36600 [Chloroflexota bacterium]
MRLPFFKSLCAIALSFYSLLSVSLLLWVTLFSFLAAFPLQYLPVFAATITPSAAAANHSRISAALGCSSWPSRRYNTPLRQPFASFPPSISAALWPYDLNFFRIQNDLRAAFFSPFSGLVRTSSRVVSTPGGAIGKNL